MKTPFESTSLRRFGSVAVACSLAVAATGSLQAQTFTWDQSISANPSVNWASGSWSPSAPTGGADQIAAFNITGAAGTLTVNSVPTITLGTIRIKIDQHQADQPQQRHHHAGGWFRLSGNRYQPDDDNLVSFGWYPGLH